MATKGSNTATTSDLGNTGNPTSSSPQQAQGTDGGEHLRGALGEIANVNHISEAKDRAREGASGVLERGREIARDGYASARENMTAVVDRGREIAGQAEDFAQDYAGTVTDYVKSNPWQGVLIGLGAGFVLGALLASSRRSA